MKSRIDTAPLITHRFPFTRIDEACSLCENIVLGECVNNAFAGGKKIK